MTERQAKILSIIVKEHVETSRPVGSSTLINKYGLNISPATARGEMAKLEKDGFLASPHTSSGRIPTDKGYRWYISSLKEPQETLKTREKEVLKKKITSFSDSDQAVKRVVDLLSDLTDSTALVTLSSNDIYYHGLRHTLRHPEFEERSQILGMADLVDHLLDFFHELPSLESEVIYVGEENPYLRKAHCSLLASPYSFKGQEGVIGLLGPTRMDYERNMLLLDFITNELNNI